MLPGTPVIEVVVPRQAGGRGERGGWDTGRGKKATDRGTITPDISALSPARVPPPVVLLEISQRNIAHKPIDTLRHIVQ